MKNLKLNFMKIALFPNLVSFSVELKKKKRKKKNGISLIDSSQMQMGKNPFIFFYQDLFTRKQQLA